MEKSAARHSYFVMPKDQLDILHQLVLAPRPTGPIPGYVKFVIPNRGLDEAAAQAKLLRKAGASFQFEGTSLRCESRTSYREALRTLFDERVKGWLGLIPSLKEEKVVTKDELQAALSKFAGKPIAGRRDR